MADLPWLVNPCPGCALPQAQAGLCPESRLNPPPWQTVYAPWAYQFPIDRLVAAFKYHHTLYLRHLFAEIIADGYPHPLPDLILPVPLHPHRLRDRGYQQTALIARQLAALWGIPCDVTRLVRSKDTAMQKTLHASERLANLAGAFVWRGKPLQDESVLLVDDVLTTGATAAAITTVLKAAGAGAVQVVCVARTLP